MKLYDHIELAKKFGDGKGIVNESVTDKPDQVAFGLSVAKRLTEAKVEEAKPIQLSAYPVPN